jgi:hypothetical protein
MPSADTVQALSPDAASTAAGRKLASPGHWKNLGQSAQAYWGECQGSALYQTRVDLSDFSSKCSCPSRKFPCKHALGLLFIVAGSATALPHATEPAWVAEWLAQRLAKATQKTEQSADAAKKPIDEKAQAKRTDARIKAITAGIELTEKWLHDLLNQGLANVNVDQQLNQAATRLQDAKAASLAERLRQIAALSEREQTRRLDELGYVQWLIDLWKKRDALTPPWRAELDGWIGLNEREEDVLAQGARIEGTFFVLGTQESEADRLRERRTWLLPENGARSYVLLEFLFGNARGAMLLPGSTITGQLALYSGRAEQRVLLADATVNTSDSGLRAPALPDFDAALHSHATQLARSPFARQSAVCVGDVTVCYADKQFYLRDQHGKALLIAGGSNSSSPGLLLYLRSGAASITVGYSFEGSQAQLLGFSEAHSGARWVAL